MAERLEPLTLPARQHDAEAVGPGEQQVVAAITIEIGDVHALEVDRPDREGAAGRKTPSSQVEEEERLGGQVEQNDLLGAVAVGVERGGPEDIDRAPSGLCTGT